MLVISLQDVSVFDRIHDPKKVFRWLAVESRSGRGLIVGSPGAFLRCPKHGERANQMFGACNTVLGQQVRLRRYWPLIEEGLKDYIFYGLSFSISITK